MHLLWSLKACKTYSSQQYWNTSLNQPTSFLLISLISWGFLCFVQFFFFGVFFWQDRLCYINIYVSFSFFHGILNNTYKDIVHRIKIFPFLSLQRSFLQNLSVRGVLTSAQAFEILFEISISI